MAEVSPNQTFLEKLQANIAGLPRLFNGIGDKALSDVALAGRETWDPQKRKQRAEWAAEVAVEYNDIVGDASLNLPKWLKKRDRKKDGITVHLGFGTKPLSETHPPKKKQLIIGVEANMNTAFQTRYDSEGLELESQAEIIERIRKRNDASVFMDVATGFDEAFFWHRKGIYDIVKTEPKNISENVYSPQSHLPDGLADTTFLEYTFADPQLFDCQGSYDDQDWSPRLLEEAARVTAPGGMIVVHDHNWILTKVARIAQEVPDIEVAGMYNADASPNEWGMLEDHFYTQKRKTIIRSSLGETGPAARIRDDLLDYMVIRKIAL